MTFFQFVYQNNNKFIDTDGAYGAQCMDLMHLYCNQVLGLPLNTLSAPTALDAYNNFLSTPQGSQFIQIKNTPWNVPRVGDIVFFGSKIGPAGHVCIFNTGNVLNFNSFDQNWPMGSASHLVWHNYYGVIGWLRKK